jgi:hypothetical protein
MYVCGWGGIEIIGGPSSVLVAGLVASFGFGFLDSNGMRMQDDDNYGLRNE